MSMLTSPARLGVRASGFGRGTHLQEGCRACRERSARAQSSSRAQARCGAGCAWGRALRRAWGRQQRIAARRAAAGRAPAAPQAHRACPPARGYKRRAIEGGGRLRRTAAGKYENTPKGLSSERCRSAVLGVSELNEARPAACMAKWAACGTRRTSQREALTAP
eukprot:scaffold133320_cov88-Phaeocystis_antarctica.AAC.1